MKPGSVIYDVNAQMPAFIDRNFPTEGSNEKVSSFVILDSMNIKKLHLEAPGSGEYRDKGSYNTVMTFIAVAVLILIIASINFMNLSTARASQRAKEVSLRKVMGASRKNLIIQFLGESILLTLIGLLISLSLVELTLPLFNEIIGKQLIMNYGSSDLYKVVALAFGVGVIGGIYPAFILSSFRPAEVLKANKSTETSTSVKLRTALVILQFTVSISLFVSTAVVYGQMLYAKTIDLGYDKENLLVIHDINRDAALEKLPLLVDEFNRTTNVTNVTWSDFTPGRPQENNTSIRTPEMAIDDPVLLGNRAIGYNYFNTYNTPMVSGREYDLEHNDIRTSFDSVRDGTAYRSSVILNESGLRRLNLGNAEDAIGKTIYRGVGPELEMELEIIGIIPDIHFDSLRAEIRPEIYFLRHDYARHLSIRFTGDPDIILNKARKLWEQEIPSNTFN